MGLSNWLQANLNIGWNLIFGMMGSLFGSFGISVMTSFSTQRTIQFLKSFIVSLGMQNKLFFYAPKKEGRLCTLVREKVGYQAKFNNVCVDSCLVQKVIFLTKFS